MKRLFTIFVLSVTAASAEASPSIKIIDRDPVNTAELEQIVLEAATQGAVCVRFPSGEWNWHCLGDLDVPGREKFSEWSSSAQPDVKGSLENWLAANKVAAVLISMSPDLDPMTYFQVEKILRSHKVAYWTVKTKPLPGNRKNELRLVETDGTANEANPETTKIRQKPQFPDYPCPPFHLSSIRAHPQNQWFSFLSSSVPLPLVILP